MTNRGNAIHMLQNRRHCINIDIDQFVLSIGYDPQTSRCCEAFLSHRGKSGTQLESTLAKIGVLISKAIQGEDLYDLDLDHLVDEKHNRQ